jgi:hypothetical protein
MGIFVCGVASKPEVDLVMPFDLDELEAVEPDNDTLMDARFDMGIRVGGCASDMVWALTCVMRKRDR